MSFQGLTPEALVERSDSKNPATTCKGLTSSGRACRRGLASTPGTSPGTSPLKGEDTNGVVAILNEGDAAAFFCWQHKDQAENLVAQVKLRADRNQTRILSLKKRSSIDTLAEKVGVLDLDAESEPSERHRIRRKHNQSSGQRIRKRDTLPQEWQQMQGPLMSVPEEVIQEALQSQSRPPRHSTPKQEKYGRSNVKASWSCCIRADDEYNDNGPPPRRRERHEQRRPSSQTRPQSYSTRPVAQTQPQPQMQERTQQGHVLHNPRTLSQQLTATRPAARPPQSSTASPPHSQTQSFLSFIPPHLDPATTSALLGELSKSFAKDDEAGYIYIFWLTPTSEDSLPDDDVASTILDGDLDHHDFLDNSPRRSSTSRRQSLTPTTDPDHRRRVNQLNRFASVKRRDVAPPKILLKIGRAQNVHRRLSQWTKQCNQNITLVRYYPHHASAAANPRSPGGAKVPHVNRVERLVHLELRGLGMGKQDKEKCADCGREHKEWFEVPATRQGLRGVDSIVRRWVEWAEKLPEQADSHKDEGGRSRPEDCDRS